MASGAPSADDHALCWFDISQKKVLHSSIFDYWTVKRRTAEGQEGDFALLRAPDWVTVIAPISFRGTESFLMVKQFRHGSSQLTMEFIAGIVETGEPPQAAAARELKEETGYEANEWILLGAVNPNPAFMTNLSYTYLALNAAQTDTQHLDPLERLQVCRVPVAEVRDRMGSGLYNNGIMLQALSLYERYLQNRR